MLPGNLYLADELIFQFRELTQFNYIHLYPRTTGYRAPNRKSNIECYV